MQSIEPLTQKWVIYFKNPDGTDNMGMTNNFHALPEAITQILRQFEGREIVIKDESIYFHEDGRAVDEYITSEEKQNNLHKALEWLHDNDIDYTSHNKGLHLKFTINDNPIDFWPTTNKIKLEDNYHCDGLQRLINLQGNNNDK